MLKPLFAAMLVAAALAGCADKQPEEKTTVIREEHNTTVEKQVPATQPAPVENNTTIINEATPDPAATVSP